jgi:DNA-binding LacI/PurR family transcriptional regulator
LSDLTRPAKAATIYDVCAAAGVSAQTVTRYLNGFTGISPKTREKVERAMKELRYRPNTLARALRTQAPVKILLFVDELTEAAATVIKAASRTAIEAGYLLETVALDRHDVAASERILRLTDQTYAAGAMALTPTRELSELFDRFPFDVPLLREINGDALGGTSAQGPTDAGMLQIIDHLHELGHRKIGVIGGSPDFFAMSKRTHTALERAAALGIEAVLIGEGDSLDSGFEFASRADTDAITALVCGSDDLAIGALSALSARGIRVPLDLSVTGYDAQHVSGFSNPPLTTVHVDFHTTGDIAVQRLIALIAAQRGEDLSPAATPTPPQLIVRGSTCPPRESE